MPLGTGGEVVERRKYKVKGRGILKDVGTRDMGGWGKATKRKG